MPVVLMVQVCLCAFMCVLSYTSCVHVCFGVGSVFWGGYVSGYVRLIVLGFSFLNSGG